MRARIFLPALALLIGLATSPCAQNATTQQAFADDIPLPILRSLAFVDIEPGRALALRDGEYRDEGRSIRLLSEMAQGDLDADGTRDVAVLLEEKTGETPTLYLAAVVQRAGRVRNMASLKLGANVHPRSVAIMGQQIEVRLLTPAAGDPPDAPSQPMTVAYKLSGSELLLMRREPGRRLVAKSP